MAHPRVSSFVLVVVLLLAFGCSKKHKKVVALTNQGIRLLDTRATEESRQKFEQALAIDNNYASAHYHMGIALHFERKLDRAVFHLRRATEIERDNVHAWYRLGKVHVDLGNLDDAETAFRQALRWDSEHAPSYFERAELLRQADDYSGADELYRAAIRSDPRTSKAFRRLASMYSRAGYLDLSVSVLTEGKRVNPEAIGLKNDLGVNLVRLGRYNEAISWLQQALGPDEPMARFNLAVALLRKGQIRDGAGQLKKFVRLGERDKRVDPDYLRTAKRVLRQTRGR
ncbi:MAG: hypothetical protein CMH54_12210 [Myxococcales bacterium]|nr:hypothetical protein [Myxococcales bacterium]